MSEWWKDVCDLYWGKKFEGGVSGDFRKIIDRNKLQPIQTDHWEWIHGGKGQYEVNKAYKILHSKREGADNTIRERKSYNKMWKSWAIRKATSTTWKILKERVPTTDNLGRRWINFSPEELKCKFCKAQDESISHVFFTCQFSSQLWNKILSWLGISSALQEDPTKHWLQFEMCLGDGVLRKAANTIWIAMVWRIWSLRNDITFNKGIGNVDKELCIIKSNIWNWMYCKEKRLIDSNLGTWVDHPRNCLELL
ncbi:hypothetical protein ACS0TY_031670 [Phlomoides rotata]